MSGSGSDGRLAFCCSSPPVRQHGFDSTAAPLPSRQEELKPGKSVTRDAGCLIIESTPTIDGAPKQNEPARAGSKLRCVVLTQFRVQNWKRKPTVGSIEDLCRKPFARPFDTCDHMMPA